MKVSEIEYDESSKDDETGLLIMNMIDWMIQSQFVIHVTNEQTTIQQQYSLKHHTSKTEV